MKDDYLWDGSGAPDSDVERLERLLAPLRAVPRPLHIPEPAARRRWQRFVPLLATAAVVAVLVGATWQAARRTQTTSQPSWQVARIAGTPRIGGSGLGATGRLAVGQTLTTDASSRARIEVSSIGQVMVQGETSIRLVATEAAHHQLALEHGTIDAFIQAPPGQFVVDTPSATATDLGCVYTLHVDDGGAGLLSVTAGWVAFELNGRESFVPAGASCPTDASQGPGTPRFDDADARWREALNEVDFGRDAAARGAALQRVLDQARRRDALTLWHLLSRVTPAQRGAVFAALASRVPPPDGVTAEAVMRLDMSALDRWWDALGLGDTTRWRTWKRPLPSAAPSVH